MPVFRVALLALCLAALPSFAAVSEDVRKFLNATTQMIENLKYENALKQLDKAKKVSKSADDDKEIALYEGVIWAEMGKGDKSEAAFKTALSMDLKAKLPFDVSPKVEKSFEKARANVEKLLGPQLAREEEERKKKAEEEAKAAEAARKAEEAKKAEQDKLARDSAPPPPMVHTEKRLVGGAARKFFWIPGIVGLGLVGGGTVGLLQARYNYDRLVSGNISPAEAIQARDSGKTQQLAGWTLVGVGSVAIVAAVGMLAFGGPTEETVTTPAVGFVPLNGGGALTFSGALP
jgi:tetratricopeptide (TPR) repeat protein